MSQKNIDLSKSKDLLYFNGLDLVSGITTSVFKVSEGHEYLSLEEHLASVLESDYFIKSDPRRQGKTVILKSDDQRKYYSDDAVIYFRSDRNSGPLIIMEGNDEPVLIISGPKANLIVVINGSWENIILNLVRSTLALVRSRFNVNINELSVWVWPGLCRDCFKAPKDLFNYLPAENKKIDLKHNLLRQLLELGVKESNIYSTNLCSAHSRNEQGYFFNSYNRNSSLEGFTNLLFAKLNV